MSSTGVLCAVMTEAGPPLDEELWGTEGCLSLTSIIPSHLGCVLPEADVSDCNPLMMQRFVSRILSAE